MQTIDFYCQTKVSFHVLSYKAVYQAESHVVQLLSEYIMLKSELGYNPDIKYSFSKKVCPRRETSAHMFHSDSCVSQLSPLSSLQALTHNVRIVHSQPQTGGRERYWEWSERKIEKGKKTHTS